MDFGLSRTEVEDEIGACAEGGLEAETAEAEAGAGAEAGEEAGEAGDEAG